MLGGASQIVSMIRVKLNDKQKKTDLREPIPMQRALGPHTERQHTREARRHALAGARGALPSRALVADAAAGCDGAERVEENEIGVDAQHVVGSQTHAPAVRGAQRVVRSARAL